MLKRRRAKVFPQILAIIELLLTKISEHADIRQAIIDDVSKHFRDNLDYLYDGLWVYYFLKVHGREIPVTKELDKNELFRSIRENKQEFYNDVSEIRLFRKVEVTGNKSLAAYLDIYPKDDN